MFPDKCKGKKFVTEIAASLAALEVPDSKRRSILSVWSCTLSLGLRHWHFKYSGRKAKLKTEVK